MNKRLFWPNVAFTIGISFIVWASITYVPTMIAFALLMLAGIVAINMEHNAADKIHAIEDAEDARLDAEEQRWLDQRETD